MKTLLVIDDEPSIAEGIAELLDWEGFAVRIAGNGALGLVEIEKGDVDAVLVDYMMPVMDGSEFVQVVRRSEAWRNLPIAMMSAVPERVIPGAGWDEFIQKPFEVDAFLPMVHRLLELRMSRGE